VNVMTRTPRIESATAIGPATVSVEWRDGGSDRVDLIGWIATGGELLAPLKDPAVFKTVGVGNFGTALFWGDEDGDLAIDTVHLEQLAQEQRDFQPADAAEWQRAMGFSNQEAADFLKVGLSTWNGYKAGSRIPDLVAIVCRSARRDPVLVHAHYRPRTTGRPKARDAGASKGRTTG